MSDVEQCLQVDECLAEPLVANKNSCELEFGRDIEALLRRLSLGCGFMVYNEQKLGDNETMPFLFYVIVGLAKFEKKRALQ